MRKGKGESIKIERAEAVPEPDVIDTDVAFHESEDADQANTDAPVIGVMGSNIKTEVGPAESDKGGKHAKPPQPVYIRKSKRMRKILIVVLILLILLLCAGGYLSYQLLMTANNAATQQQSVQVADVDTINDEEPTKDVSTTVARKTSVPDLVALLDLTVDEAIETLQHGAQLTSSYEVNEEGSPIKQEVRLALTTEPSDSRSGTPTIYLSLDENGLIIQSGYSVGTSSLGYGSLSFTDAVQNEHIIEKTLDEAGMIVQDGTLLLPDDKMLYSTYASDGATLTKETYNFEGTGVSNTDRVVNWDAILTYDYSTANATGNLADTIRMIYIYVSDANTVLDAEPEAE